MAILDPRLINNLPDTRVFVTASGINKTLKDAIEDGDIGGGGGGGAPLEVFNHVVSVGAPAATLTGLSYFMAPVAFNITSVRLLVYTKNGVASGFLEADIKKNTTPAGAGMVSILTTKPIINFASDPDYTLSSGVIATAAVANNNFLRLDITSIPTGWAGRFQVLVYGS
jgi:hypothetical protein